MEPHVFTPLDMGRILEAPQIKLGTNWTTKMVAPLQMGKKGIIGLIKETTISFIQM